MLVIGTSPILDEGFTLQIQFTDFTDEVFGMPDFAHCLKVSALYPFSAACALECFLGYVVLLLSGACRCG